jgi:hypothetical protein
MKNHATTILTHAGCFFVTLTLGPGGCSSPPAPATDSDFVSHVVWRPADSIPVLRLRPEARICSPEKRSTACALVRDPKEAYVIGDRDVVLLDANVGLVKMDSAGNYISQIGQFGHGLGQYFKVSTLGIDKSGALIIWDPYHSRITRFGDSAVTFGWVREPLTAVRVGPNGALGLTVSAADHTGDNAPATIAAISMAGKMGRPIATVLAPASRSIGSDLLETPLLIWQTPVWDVLTDGRFVYVPFGRALRIEIYDPDGAPSLLITGDPPFQAAAITPTIVRQLEDTFFRRIYDEPLDSAAQRCDSLRRLPNRRITTRCRTVEYAYAQGARLPATYPPIMGVVHLAHGAFTVRTSHVDHGFTRWLLVTPHGKRVGQFALRSNERVIGGSMQKIAVADTTDGHVAIAWNTVNP